MGIAPPEDLEGLREVAALRVAALPVAPDVALPLPSGDDEVAERDGRPESYSHLCCSVFVGIVGVRMDGGFGVLAVLTFRFTSQENKLKSTRGVCCKKISRKI